MADVKASLDEQFKNTIAKVNSGFERHADNCYNQNMGNPEGFSNCIAPHVSKYDDFKASLNMYENFLKKSVMKAHINGYPKEHFDKLSTIMEQAYQSLGKRYE